MYRQMYNRSMDPMGIGCRNAVFLFFFSQNCQVLKALIAVLFCRQPWKPGENGDQKPI